MLHLTCRGVVGVGSIHESSRCRARAATGIVYTLEEGIARHSLVRKVLWERYGTFVYFVCVVDQVEEECGDNWRL